MNPYSEISSVQKVRVTPAQEAIQAAFLQMYKEKDLLDISVKALCEKAHVARTTFYANYMNTEELLEEIEDGLIYELLQVNDRCEVMKDIEHDNCHYMKNMLDFVINNHTALTILLLEQPDMKLINKWKMAVKYHYWDYVSAEAEKEGGYALEMIASMAVAAYTYLLEHPGEVDIKKVYQLFLPVLQSLQI